MWIFAPLPLIWAVYALTSFSISCALVAIPSNFVTKYFDRVLKYGKLSTSKKQRQHFVQTILNMEVPKRYFVHFYMFASITCTLVAIVMFCSLCLKMGPPTVVMNIVDFLASDTRITLGSSTATLLTIILLTLHVYRRLYECVWISIFSDSKMSIFNYCIGMAFYALVPLSILAETPGFDRKNIGQKNGDSYELHWYSISGVLLYFGMVFYQYRCAIALSNLRKNKEGRVISHAYKMPMGPLFANVSCPHYLAEVGIYFAFNMILGFQSILCLLIFAFVAVNQTVAAIWTHQWYLANYPDYPKHRKAIFPFFI